MTPLSLAGSVTPSPDEARTLLRRELLAPEYHEQQLLERILTALARMFRSGVDAAARMPPLTVLAAMLVLALLVLGLTWLLTRLRAAGVRRTVPMPGTVLDEERHSAAELRRRAAEALAQGRPGEAVVDGFRALAVGQVEAGRLDDLPGATAREVAASIATTLPEHNERLTEAAYLFDLVHYGHRPVTTVQAASVLALDDDLAVRR